MSDKVVFENLTARVAELEDAINSAYRAHATEPVAIEPSQKALTLGLWVSHGNERIAELEKERDALKAKVEYAERQYELDITETDDRLVELSKERDEWKRAATDAKEMRDEALRDYDAARAEVGRLKSDNDILRGRCEGMTEGLPGLKSVFPQLLEHYRNMPDCPEKQAVERANRAMEAERTLSAEDLARRYKGGELVEGFDAAVRDIEKIREG